MEATTKELTGRELDAAIARGVFGYDNVRTDHLGDLVYGVRTGPGIAPWDEGHGHRVPYYSTDIAAAWQVAEAIGLFDCHSLARKWQAHDRRPGKWVVRDSNPYHGDEDEIAQGDTAPEAICRAALAALLV